MEARGEACGRAARLLAASLTLSVTWAVLVMYGLISPLYVIRGDPVHGYIALLGHRVVYLGHRLEVPLLSALSLQLLPVLAAAVYSIGAAAYAIHDTLSRGRPTLAAASASLLSALIALASIGPLTGASRVAARIAATLTTGLRYAVNSGYIDLGRAVAQPGPALPLVGGPLSLTSALAIVLTALAAAADAAAEACELAAEGEPGGGPSGAAEPEG